MKVLNVVAAFLGGLALGAAAGVLFAPEKGEDTRRRIAALLREKGSLSCTFWRFLPPPGSLFPCRS